MSSLVVGECVALHSSFERFIGLLDVHFELMFHVDKLWLCAAFRHRCTRV